MDIEQKVLGIIGSKRVKGTIIKVLSEQGSLNLNEIYKIIVRSYFLNVTRQAVHKMLKNLQDQNVLIQQEKKYSINLSWVEELEQFSKKLKNGILLHSPIYLEGLSDFKEFSGEKIFTFDSLNAAEEYRKKLQKEYLTQVGKKPVYVGYSKHIKSPLVYSEKSISILNLIKKNNSECIILVSGNSKTDEWCAQYYRNEFIRVKIGCDLTNNCEMMVLGDVITQLFIPIELQKKFDELYLKTDQIGKINIPKLFDQIYSSNEEIKFIVYKNNELANQLRKLAIGYFDKEVSLFDIDGTLINGILPIEFVRFLSKKYLFKKIYLYKIESAFNDYQNKKINYEMFTDIIINNYAKGLKGQKETVIKIEAESFIESIKDKIFEYSIDLITLIKQIGKVVAITGSPIELVDAIQKILPFDEIFATKINCVKGVYSGKVDFNCAKLESKKVVINKYLINKKIYLKFGFGDTLSDLAIFKVVKTPVIFGNNKKLINIAKKNNWLIITDEKKVISIIKSYLK